jgi:hypothetical protein
VEQNLERHGLTQQEAARNAIQLLVANRRDPNKRDLFHALISAGYKPHWTAEQQAYFDRVWPLIQFKHDYFLSFTSRHPTPDLRNPNPINSSYKHFIKHVLGEAVWKSDHRDTNLLARAIHARLEAPPIRGFYYPRDQYDNAETEKKLEAACDASLIFVQLIQAILFEPPPHAKNYCFFEWERVSGQLSAPEREQRILYVLAAMDHRELQNLNPPTDYDQWHRHIAAKDRPHLPMTLFWKQTVLQDLDERIATSLLTRIKDAWIQLSIGVPPG